MFLRRVVEHLKTQNWTAVGLDLAIVIVGVFIGTQVSNWNQVRIEKQETERLLLELRPALKSFSDFFDTAKPYYATTRAYSDTAFAGWRGDPAVGDEQFVISAYQASQVYVFRIDGENFVAIFGSERLRDIDDVEVRRGLINLMTFNYSQVEIAAMATRYREQVRRTIPIDIQEAIRAECGDKPVGGQRILLHLPPACDLDLPDARFAAAAAELRAHPELVGELRWHLAATATFFANLEIMDEQTGQLQQALERTGG